MPLIKKTIYLREEDLELWKACPNKSLLIHNALNKMPEVIDEPSAPRTKVDIPGVTTASKLPTKYNNITYQKKGSWGA